MSRTRTLVWESLFSDSVERTFYVREDEPALAAQVTPASDLQRRETIEEVQRCIAALPRRARNIIVRRYGLRANPESLARIGRSYGISKQRISQLEVAAIKELRLKLRKSSKI